MNSFPEGWLPQQAVLASAPFDNPDWLFETKFDGYRTLALIQSQKVKLISRNGLSFNAKYPEIVTSLQPLTDNLILDGEIVVEDSQGNSRFQWLQNREENPKKGKLKLYVFDILYFNGYDLRQIQLEHRKQILKALLPVLDTISYSEHLIGSGISFFKQAKEKGREGIIAKKRDSKYHTNLRSKDWLKIKTTQQQEMVIGGFTNPQGSRKGFGALLCGYYKNDQLHYSGKVGTGFSEKTLEELYKQLEKMQRKASPFIHPPKEPGVHWVEPKLVAQIQFSEFTESGSMRHPVYLGLRIDKNAKEVLAEFPQVDSKEFSENDFRNENTAKTAEAQIPIQMKSKVEFTNLDKVFWPIENITKGDVIAYYEAIADFILPYLKDRPESLRRNPDGIKNEGFFQKNVAGLVPDWIQTEKIQSASTQKQIEYLLCQDKETLLFLANWGCIELNPWSSRIGSLNHPDYIIFDLDPKDSPLKNTITTALKLKEILDELQVPAYIKTSGGKGLHVFIPILPEYTYEETRNFSHLISQMVVRELPEISSLERIPEKRKGKVYLDFLQNGKGKTMASVYSLRPRENATVSTPLQWDEVANSLDFKTFHIHSIPKRLQEKGDLWKDFFKERIDLKSILKQL